MLHGQAVNLTPRHSASHVVQLSLNLAPFRKHCPQTRHRSRAKLIRSALICAASTDGQYPVVDWQERNKQRVFRELSAAGKKMGVTADSIQEGIATMEMLLPGFLVDMEAMKASDWVTLITNADLVAVKVITLKRCFPSLDLPLVLNKFPRLLNQDVQQLEKSASKVAEMLSPANDPAAIIHELPQMLNPGTCVSVLVTLQRWFPNKDPLSVLEADPDIIRRAQENDVPLEPVFFDGENFSAPQNTRRATQPWQKWIRENVYKTKAQPGVGPVPPAEAADAAAAAAAAQAAANAAVVAAAVAAATAVPEGGAGGAPVEVTAGGVAPGPQQ